MALSYSHIQISAEARPYSLATMLLLAAFAGLLEVVADPRGARPEVVRRCLGLAALAAWTEYATLIAIAAMAFCVAAFSLGSQAYRAEVAQLARRQCFALASFVVALVALGLYLGWSNGLGGHTYLLAFAPDGSESLAHFALRGTAAILSYFTPFTFRVDTVLVITLLLAVAVVVALGIRFVPRRSSHHDRRKAVVVLMPVLLLTLIFLLCHAGLYPFGGYMRHQFILFPFALLLLLTALDVTFRALPWAAARIGLCAVLGAATLAAAITAQSSPPNEEFPRDALWRDEVLATRQRVANGDWLYMPSLSLYGFAGSLRGWSWRVIGSCGPMCSLLLAEHDGQQIHVAHDRARFVLPRPLDASLVASFAGLMRQRRAKVLWVLDMQREPPNSPQTTAAPEVLARNGLSFEQAASFRDGALLRFTIR